MRKKGGEGSFLAALLLAFFLVFAAVGAFIAYKVNQCSQPGFVPYGCPIVVHVGR